MKTKLMFAALGVACVVLFAGCGDEPETEATPEPATEPAEPETDSPADPGEKISAFDDGTFELKGGGAVQGFVYVSTVNDTELAVVNTTGNFMAPFNLTNWRSIAHARKTVAGVPVDAADCAAYGSVCTTLKNQFGTPANMTCIYGESSLVDWSEDDCPTDNVGSVVYGAGVYELRETIDGAITTVGYLLSNTGTGQGLCVTKKNYDCRIQLAPNDALTMHPAPETFTNTSFACSGTDYGRDFIGDAKNHLECPAAPGECDPKEQYETHFVVLRTSTTCSD